MNTFEISIKLKEIRTMLNQININQTGKLELCASVVDREAYRQFTTGEIIYNADLVIYKDPYGTCIPLKNRLGPAWTHSNEYTLLEKIAIVYKIAKSYWKFLK